MIELWISARPDALEPARVDVLDRLQPYGLSARASHRIELVLEEVLMNLAWHAWDDGGDHAFVLSVEVDDDTITLHFEDDGRPFDPLSRLEPLAPRTLADAAPGGLGIALVRRNARAVRYERRGDHNCLSVEIDRR